MATRLVTAAGLLILGSTRNTMIGLGEILVLLALALGVLVLLGYLRIHVRRRAKDRFSIDVQMGQQPGADDDGQPLG